MKKNQILKSAIMMVLFFALTVCASAQNKVTNVNTRSAKACREHLSVHPSDTIVNTIDVLKEGKKIGAVRRLVFLKDGQTTLRVDTLQFRDTTTDEVAYQDKRAYLDGKISLSNPHHKDMEGKNRHKAGVEVEVGAQVIDGEVASSAGVGGFYETCLFVFGMQGSISRAKYTDQAQVLGHYMTFRGTASVDVKVWQDKLYRNYVSVGFSGGYAYQKTDSDDAEFMSKNYGWTGDAHLKVSLGLTRTMRLHFKGGYGITPEVLHDGGTQKFSHGGIFVNAGLGFIL